MKKAGDLLNVYFDDVQKKSGEQFNNFHESWKKIAGEKIGNNTSIKDIEDGKLIIEIDHPGWKQLIKFKEKKIIWQIKKEFPELSVEKIVYYFKNNSQSSPNIEKNELKPKEIKEEVVIENSDFSDLLKKMSKRSQE